MKRPIKIRRSRDGVHIIIDPADPMLRGIVEDIKQRMKKAKRDKECDVFAADAEEPPEIEPGG